MIILILASKYERVAPLMVIELLVELISIIALLASLFK